MKPAYYNEIDKYAAQWLRNLIAEGHIAPGDVDERSIEDVRPDDLRGYVQCHFFAGIGVWSHALRLAGVPDSMPVWTGSCPCQPFSAAGKGAGFADERHLWPAFHHLIRERRPAVVFGEQVASKDGLAWLDLVHADLEGAGYAFGAADLCAAGVGAPHIRQRLYWVADSSSTGLEGRDGRALGHEREAAERGGSAGALADDDDGRKGLVGAGGTGLAQRETHGEAVRGFWAGADWIPCRDGKARPVEPLPLEVVDGAAESLGRLRSDAIEALTGEVNDWALRHQTCPGEALQHVWRSLSAQALRQRAAGRHGGVSQPPVLLAFLRQLQDQGWALAQGLPRAGEETPAAGLRMLRSDDEVAGTPLRRGLDEQQHGEPADAVHVLSSLLARHAQAAWGETFDAHAAASFVLTHGAPARVGRLRAYGNAIVAPLATEFIGAWLDCQP